jgi:hypothetical protein
VNSPRKILLLTWIVSVLVPRGSQISTMQKAYSLFGVFCFQFWRLSITKSACTSLLPSQRSTSSIIGIVCFQVLVGTEVTIQLVVNRHALPFYTSVVAA